MPLTDRARLADEASHPLIVELWRALQPLQTVVSFMNTGAHPDDETSAMLAAMAWRDGIDISYACSTRGEGGQNDIGTEAGAALGVLRTAEMEAACDVLGLRMYWLSEGPDDAIFDFGFSKSGKETLGRWGEGRTLARFVHILRRERPDSPLLDDLGERVPDGPVLEADEAEDVAPEARFGQAVRHTRPMLSLDKCYSNEELETWAGKFEGEIMAMPKMDGIAASLRTTSSEYTTPSGFEYFGTHQMPLIDGSSATSRSTSSMSGPSAVIGTVTRSIPRRSQTP